MGIIGFGNFTRRLRGRGLGWFLYLIMNGRWYQVYFCFSGVWDELYVLDVGVLDGMDGRQIDDFVHTSARNTWP